MCFCGVTDGWCDGEVADGRIGRAVMRTCRLIAEARAARKGWLDAAVGDGGDDVERRCFEEGLEGGDDAGCVDGVGRGENGRAARTGGRNNLSARRFVRRLWEP